VAFSQSSSKTLALSTSRQVSLRTGFGLVKGYEGKVRIGSRGSLRRQELFAKFAHDSNLNVFSEGATYIPIDLSYSTLRGRSKEGHLLLSIREDGQETLASIFRSKTPSRIQSEFPMEMYYPESKEYFEGTCQLDIEVREI
jgi:hypothetical protein